MNRKYSILFLVTFCYLISYSQTYWEAKFDFPVSFVENVGQFKSPDGRQVLYAYDDGAYRVLFTPTGIVHLLTQKSESDTTPDYNYPEKELERKTGTIVKDWVGITWENMSARCHLKAVNKSQEYYSYQVLENGNEVNKNYVKGYKKIVYENVYNGIDAEYIIHPNGGIEYSFKINSYANVSDIRMKYSKVISLNTGKLLQPTLFGNITDHQPSAYYSLNLNQSIASTFKLYNNTTAGFQVDPYDHSKPIIIDPWSQSPVLNNAKKIWEVETDNAGNVYIYGGDMPVRILKYNSAGTLLWNYASAIDSANYWIGGFVTNQITGDSYITSGSIGKIWKISTAGAMVWTNNPSGSNEYWSLSFNCDGTKLGVGGSRGTLSIRGYMFDINLATGAQGTIKLIGYGGMGFPPTLQEASSICWGPYNNYFFLTLDTIGSVSDAMTTMNFKTSTGYLFDYYIPNFGFGTKQPISATRANTIALYTTNGTTVHKRSLTTGAVLATAAIPGGSSATGFLGGRKLPNNAGIDIDDCGNVYAGSSNQLVKYDQNLVQLSTVATPFPIYDVDVSISGDVAVCGFAGGTGYVRAIAMSACAQVTPVCISTLPVTLSSFDVKCEKNKARIEWETQSEKNCSFFSILRSVDGVDFTEIGRIAGNGNSNSAKHYQVYDETPYHGTSYYKLQQVDFDDTKHEFETVVFDNVCNTDKKSIVKVFPNPHADKFMLEIDAEKETEFAIEIFNSTGQKINELISNQKIRSGEQFYQFETDYLQPGLYFLKVFIDGEYTTISVVKQSGKQE